MPPAVIINQSSSASWGGLMCRPWPVLTTIFLHAFYVLSFLPRSTSSFGIHFSAAPAGIIMLPVSAQWVVHFHPFMQKQKHLHSMQKQKWSDVRVQDSMCPLWQAPQDTQGSASGPLL